MSLKCSRVAQRGAVECFMANSKKKTQLHELLSLMHFSCTTFTTIPLHNQSHAPFWSRRSLGEAEIMQFASWFLFRVISEFMFMKHKQPLHVASKVSCGIKVELSFSSRRDFPDVLQLLLFIVVCKAKHQSSFQLIYWSCEDDNHLSLSTNSCKSNWTRRLVFVLSPSRFIFRRQLPSSILVTSLLTENMFIVCSWSGEAERWWRRRRRR